MNILEINKGEVAVGAQAKIVALVKQAELKTWENANGKGEFMLYKFEDKTDAIGGIMFSPSGEAKEIKIGDLVRIEATVGTQKGRDELQLQIDTRKGNKIVVDPTIDREEVMQSAPVPRAEMQAYIDAKIAEIENEDLKLITTTVMGRMGKFFYEWPAAKVNHHAYLGGLAYHTSSMLKLAEGIMSVYPEGTFDRDLMFAGIILHDIAKVLEMSENGEYSIRGNLLGHLVMGSEIIDEVAIENGLDPKSQKIMLLKHIILSHHGKLEWGSPVAPRIIEAEIIHYIDNIDAKVNMIIPATDKVPNGSLSAKIFGLDNRQFLKH
ncbi:MAG: HD domain-containing protein [Lactobacillales bacterium]|jgi:3'-5' exoribonuclease|nr:HD domain-containing protein [Lactobacillales bacterium]